MGGFLNANLSHPVFDVLKSVTLITSNADHEDVSSFIKHSTVISERDATFSVMDFNVNLMIVTFSFSKEVNQALRCSLLAELIVLVTFNHSGFTGALVADDDCSSRLIVLNHTLADFEI